MFIVKKHLKCYFRSLDEDMIYISKKDSDIIKKYNGKIYIIINEEIRKVAVSEKKINDRALVFTIKFEDIKDYTAYKLKYE